MCIRYRIEFEFGDPFPIDNQQETLLNRGVFPMNMHIAAVKFCYTSSTGVLQVVC